MWKLGDRRWMRGKLLVLQIKLVTLPWTIACMQVMWGRIPKTGALPEVCGNLQILARDPKFANMMGNVGYIMDK